MQLRISDPVYTDRLVAFFESVGQNGSRAINEAFRELRTNLHFIDVDNPPRVLLVTSSVPSEGKSAVVSNLAATMVAAGEKVVVGLNRYAEKDEPAPRIFKADSSHTDRTSLHSATSWPLIVLSAWGRLICKKHTDS